MKWVRTSIVLSLLILVTALAGAADKPLWSFNAGSEVKWQRVTSLGFLLVGTPDALTCLDTENGAVLWKRTDLDAIEPDSTDELEGTPILLVTTKNQLHAVNIEDGKNFWQSEKIKGAIVGMVPLVDKDMVVLLSVPNNRYNRAKPDMAALKLDSGEAVWETQFPENVDLHTIERAGKWIPRFDLSGHQPPVYDDSSIYFTYAGLHKFDIASGKLVWKNVYDVTEGTLKRGNAPAIVDGDVVYTSAKGVIRAIDRDSGQTKWTSADFGAAVAQVEVHGDRIYGRMGGNFFDYAGRAYVLKKPLGVISLSKNSGQTVWRFDNAKESITNMLLLPEQNRIALADRDNLYLLDTTAEGKVKEAFKAKLEFKNKLGGGARAARTGLKFARGGLMGMMKKDKEDFDPPVSISMRGNGMAVVQGTTHLLAFDPKATSVAWSVQFEAPGSPAWQLAAMGAITAYGYSANLGVAMNTQRGTGMNNAANQNKNRFAAGYQKLLTKRYTATEHGSNFTYILSKVEDGKKEVPGIIGVSLDSGQVTGEVAVGDRDPDYVVDEHGGRLFVLKDKKELVAYSFR